MNTKQKNYLDEILASADDYLRSVFSCEQIEELNLRVNNLKNTPSKNNSIDYAIKEWLNLYIKFVKEVYQKNTSVSDEVLVDFINQKDDGIKIIWGNCLNVLKNLPSESLGLMVTSPPYYNAREYSHWDNLDLYLNDMRNIIREAYRVLDNHRVFVFNVGDIFDNDNLFTTSVWGKRRIPLGSYFTKIFEEEGFTFVDDFIWDKGEVQSQRQKNGNKPYPFYQYPLNCYEHILIFHKHRDDKLRYPCPICGSLQVNGNAYSEIGLKSWECKNPNCFKRSKSNRGKRFSLKSIITQGMQNQSTQISEDYIAKWRRDIVKIKPVFKINSKGENKLGHTAPFPYEIPEFAIQMFSYPGDIVFDPFGGSFTSVIAAKKLGRIGLSTEINKEMFRKSSINNIRKYFPNNKISEVDYERKQ
ncbi:MAG: site-specific DNA-methyltransferase [Ruminococcaceae bacterium]|jgi:DNA modification methylase|nr:site-specific DNA-methyltransferase [Oscillospiraceae bacterium]